MPNARSRDKRVTAILGGMGLMCVLFGLGVVVVPTWVGEVIGYRFATDGAKLDFTTVYGGFFGALGVFWLLSPWRPEWREAGAALLAITSTGAMVVRGTGAMILGITELQTLGIFAGELLMTAVGWATWGWSWREREAS